MKINADYDSVQRYRYSLREATEELKEQVMKTEQIFVGLNLCLKDNQFAEFKKAFEQDKKIIDAFCEYEDILEMRFLRRLKILMRPDVLFR